MDEQLRAFFAELAKAAEAGDREAYTALFRDDASLIAPHRAPLIGRAAIGNWFDGFIAAVELHLSSYEQEQVDVIGNTAMIRSRGTGHYLIKATGEEVPFDQTYLDVLVQENGAWRMAYHVAASSTSEPGLWDPDWGWVWGE